MTILFICLGIDAGGTLEVAAEVCRVGKAELVGSLLDRLPWVCVHDPLRLRHHQVAELRVKRCGTALRPLPVGRQLPA